MHTAALDKYSNLQKSILALLRIVIGWHFLYEGVSKLLIPDWTSAGYLQNSRWIFAGFFHWIAANPTVLAIVDFINIWGLILVGLCLVLGLFTKVGAWLGIGLLALYYVANPPFVGIDFGLPTEGNYVIVDKNLVEIFALLAVVFFPAGWQWGLDSLVFGRGEQKAEGSPKTESAEPVVSSFDRRVVLKSLATVPLLGAFAIAVAKKYNWEKINAITGATIKVSDTKLKDLKGELETGTLGQLKISRLIMGGNLIGGWAHSRDLIYVPSLFKAYNTERKIFETLQIGEKAGINMINITGIQFPVINKYKRIYGSKLQTMCQVHPTKEDNFGTIDAAIDAGVDLVQIQGNCVDWRVRDGEIDVLVKAIDYIKKQGYPAGLGAHSVHALRACDEAGIVPDFYMKTLHHDKYWSAHPKPNRIPFSVDGEKSANHNEFHDNMFCLFPDETIEYMKSKKIPFFAFKVLAGGAIHPSEAFRFAFENGADFLCVGMFDWQVVDDVNIAIETLEDLEKQGSRQRPWIA
ncbi:DoxX family membrane protein [candidate division KSB1 bacterium]|nr:DoxX family membrane protein [candidate division KSB1 bacterium]